MPADNICVDLILQGGDLEHKQGKNPKNGTLPRPDNQDLSKKLYIDKEYN